MVLSAQVNLSILEAGLVGKKVLKTKTRNINVSNLSSGIYFAKIATDKGSINLKVINHIKRSLRYHYIRR